MSSSMPWVKMYTEMLDDPKIGRLPDAIKWRFVSLVLLAGECDQDGALISGSEPMSVTDIAWRLRVTREQCETEINPLIECGILSDDAGLYFIPKFSERQGRPQSEKRAMWRERQARLREQKETKESVTRDSLVTNASRVEKSREEKIRKDIASNDAGEPHKKAPTERQQASTALETHFSALSGLPLPERTTDKQKKSAASRWWNPLLEIWELCKHDTDKAAQIIGKAYTQMSADNLTISAPASVLEVAKSLYAKNGHATKEVQWLE